MTVMHNRATLPVVKLRTSPWLWSLVLLLLLVAYLRWLSPSLSPYAGGSDSSGYMWSARLFRHGTLSVPIQAPPSFPVEATGTAVFIPLGGTVRPGTMTLVPTYPTGVPLHLAAANLILDEERATKTVLLFAAAGALWLLYLLGREAGLPRPWAAAGSAILACSPLFLQIAVQPFSDVLATLWVEAAVLCAWRSRRRPGLAWLAGASLGIATLVRPMNLVIVLPVLAALSPRLAPYVRLIGGGLPFAAFVLAYQAWAYGSPLRSGYGDVSGAFLWRAVLPSLRHYVLWCPRLASWIIVFLPAAAWAWRGPLARWRLIAIAWIGATFGTYAFYVLTSETWWYMRFVLPGFPIVIVSGLAGLRAIVQGIAVRLPAGRPAQVAGAAALVIIVLSLGALIGNPLFQSHYTVRFGERTYRDALKMLAIGGESQEPMLMMQMTGAANFYRPDLRFLRFDMLTPTAWSAVRQWQRQARQPIGAAVFDFEGDQLLGGAPALSCDWQARGHYLNVLFWECPPE